MKPTASRSRRGLTLVEMLGYMALISAFTFVSGHVFVSLIQVQRDAGDAQTRIAHFDRFVHLLEQDMWNARGLSAGDERTIIIAQFGGRDVFWQLDKTGTTAPRSLAVNDEVTERRDWPTGPPVEFERDEAVLVVRAASADMQRGCTVRLSSQIVNVMVEPR